jgi:hypothetical protein
VKEKRIQIKPFVLAFIILFLLAYGSVLLWRTPVAFAVFSNRQICGLCGYYHSELSIVCLDKTVARFENQEDSRISRILGPCFEKKCEHAFYETKRSKFILSVSRERRLVREKLDWEFGADVYNSRQFSAALNSIALTNGNVAKRIWREALRNSFVSNGPALKQTREALERPEGLPQFLSTNRYYQPRIPAVVRAFE